MEMHRDVAAPLNRRSAAGSGTAGGVGRYQPPLSQDGQTLAGGGGGGHHHRSTVGLVGGDKQVEKAVERASDHYLRLLRFWRMAAMAAVSTTREPLVTPLEPPLFLASSFWRFSRAFSRSLRWWRIPRRVVTNSPMR